MITIEKLAINQLDAYNRSNLEDFCDCYHKEVRVLDRDGNCTINGIKAFRDKYHSMFTTMQFGASVSQRIILNYTCIDKESWWRIDPKTSVMSEGEIIVRYELKDEKIFIVQFID